MPNIKGQKKCEKKHLILVRRRSKCVTVGTIGEGKIMEKDKEKTSSRNVAEFSLQRGFEMLVSPFAEKGLDVALVMNCLRPNESDPAGTSWKRELPSLSLLSLSFCISFQSFHESRTVWEQIDHSKSVT